MSTPRPEYQVPSAVDEYRGAAATKFRTQASVAGRNFSAARPDGVQRQNPPPLANGPGGDTRLALAKPAKRAQERPSGPTQAPTAAGTLPGPP